MMRSDERSRLRPVAKNARRVRLSLERVMDAIECGESAGFCLACGAECCSTIGARFSRGAR